MFSILYNAGLAFLAISITFLGLGAAGVAAAMFPHFFRAERLKRMIPRLALVYSVTLTVCVILLAGVNESMGEAAGELADSLNEQVKRVAVASAILVPPMFLVGLFFPRGIRYIEKCAPELVPWAWGANSAASVLGSILALIVAIHGGFALTSLLSGSIYLLLGIPAARTLARRTA